LQANRCQMRIIACSGAGLLSDFQLLEVSWRSSG
jgi:hypothetical protein